MLFITLHTLYLPLICYHCFLLNNEVLHLKWCYSKTTTTKKQIHDIDTLNGVPAHPFIS